MKKIEAIIRKTKFEEVKDALLDADIEWFSYYDVRGIGKARQGRIYRGVVYDTSSIERILISIVVRDKNAEKTVHFLNGICYLAAGHFNAELLHCVLEFDTILAALDCVDLNADHLHVVLFKYASLAQLGAEVQTGLTAEVRQQRVGALLLYDLGEPVNVERLDVGDVGYIGVGHDGGGVGVHQYYLISQPAKRLARLRTGIVELARLSDDDRT